MAERDPHLTQVVKAARSFSAVRQVRLHVTRRVSLQAGIRLAPAGEHAVSRILTWQAECLVPQLEQQLRDGIDAHTKCRERLRIRRRARVLRQHAQHAAQLPGLYAAVQDRAVIAHELGEIVDDDAARALV